ncbi:hypothetical protein C8R46DRAFT_943127 [Mycena filopes]|nr:hypothetical protein C8R46DRAFT_943127 [Mycena filopes]
MEISELERSLGSSSLNEENDLLRHRLDAYTYPVLTLPSEIVSEIFVHFLPVYPQTPPIIGRASPNVLAQICQEWRDIAVTTPRLWRGIGFSLDYGRRIRQKLHLLETWLQRSGACLLSINISVGYDQHTMEPFLAAIVAHRLRWEHLGLHSYMAEFPVIEANLPFLRTVYIKTLPTGPADGASFASALCAAPLLRTVAVFYPDKNILTQYPWSQLTTFIARSITPQQCAEVLAEATSLVYCELSVAQVANPSLPRGITLPYLSTLILRCYPRSRVFNSPWGLLDTLTLPALLTLEISESSREGRDPVASLQSLISRSGCSIQTLHITRSKISPAVYRLALTPNVRELIFLKIDFSLSAVGPFVHPFALPRDEVEDASDNGGRKDGSIF